MRVVFYLTLLLCVSQLFACSSTALVNFISPDGHYEKFTDITYGDLPRQKLDLYLPKSSQNDNILIVFFYGGSWDSGSKDQYKFVASTLTQQGYNVAIPDYRLYPEVIFPAFVEDAAKSVAWLQENYGKYFNNEQKVYLMGHSAGAQIASLLVSDKSYLNAAGANSEKLTGFIGLAGPYNFLPLKSNKLKRIFPKNIRSSSQPINFISGNEVPFLLLHGKSDTTVVPENSLTFSDKINKYHGAVTLELYDDIGHIGIIKPFVRGFEDSVPTIQDIVNFIDKTSDNKT